MTSKVYNENNPVGFDFEVYQIQNQLAQLNLLEAIFGVCHLQVEYRDNLTTEDKYLLQDMGKKGTSKHERWFPQGRANGSNIDLSIKDSYSSRVFFLAKDQIDTNPSEDEWGWPEGNPEIRQQFSIIIHCSLQKIQYLNIGITTQEQFKLQILRSLNQIPLLIVKGMSENITNVWKEFTMTPEINGFGLYPYYVLRLECEIPYYPLGINGGTYFTLPKFITGWVVCKIICNIVAGSPNPANVQVLSTGDVILVEYNLNGDNTLTVPILNSASGIGVLTYFALNKSFYDGEFFINGKIDTSSVGSLGIGDTLKFDASIPIWSN